MKKPQLFALIRLVSKLTGIEQPIIVGSQSLYAATDAVPAFVTRSAEADFMLADWGIEAIKLVNDKLGVTSDLYHTAGYYADGLGLATVVLVPGWRDRLQRLTDEQGQIIARCLKMHDAAVSKLMAGRDKDWPFIKALLDGNLISLPPLAKRAALLQDAVYEDALPPRLRKLIESLRPSFRLDELRPLTELANHLSARS